MCHSLSLTLLLLIALSGNEQEKSPPDKTPPDSALTGIWRCVEIQYPDGAKEGKDVVEKTRAIFVAGKLIYIVDDSLIYECVYVTTTEGDAKRLNVTVLRYGDRVKHEGHPEDMKYLYKVEGGKLTMARYVKRSAGKEKAGSYPDGMDARGVTKYVFEK